MMNTHAEESGREAQIDEQPPTIAQSNGPLVLEGY